MKIKLNKVILTIGALALTSCQASFKDYGLLNGNSKVISSAQSHQKYLNSTREYERCVDEGYFFDKKASDSKDNSISLYSKSAEILSKCDQIVGNYNAIITQDQRMKNYALSIQNYLKSGRLKVASLKLEDFKNKFDRDLIYSDGSSFIKNTEAILDIANEKKGLDLEMTNSNRKIKSELKRIWYWSKK